MRGVMSTFLVFAVLISTTTGTTAQNPIVVQPDVRVLRISAGTSGTETNGVFVLNDERTFFSRTTDREVIVFFQWDGVPGPHKLVAKWRSPDESSTTNSAIDYVARERRFGAYWRLNLSPGMMTGTWTIEATVDGQPAGRFAFEIHDETVPSPTPKRPLPQAELYDALNRVFVSIERSVRDHRPTDPTAGFFAGPGRIYTALATVDGADALTAVAAGGSRQEISSVVGLNRQQDWAAFADGRTYVSSLPVASAGSLRVGDRCFSIEGTASRVLIEGSINGERGAPSHGLIAVFINGAATPGAPVVNEYGELVGLIGGSGVPGTTSLRDFLRFRAELRGVPIVPLPLVRIPRDPVPQPIAELQRRGDLVLPVVGEEHIVSGGFARRINKGTTVTPGDQREAFAVAEKTFVTFINWSPQVRVKGRLLLRVFDADNRGVLESQPGTIDLRKNQVTLTSWSVPLPISSGLFRVDVLVNDRTFWRGFVRITP